MEPSTIFILLACFITGISKFSVGGMGMVILPLMMLVYPGPEALAVIVPLYCLTDMVAISTYRKNINWGLLIKLLPLCAVGVLGGAIMLKGIDTQLFITVVGLTVLLLLLLSFWLDYFPLPVFTNKYAVWIAGPVVGFISMVANAAGPLMGLFLLEQKMEKQAFVSTRCWFFMTTNLLKLIALASIGLINIETIETSLVGIPALVLGMWIGYLIVDRLPQRQFKILVRIAISISAMNLLFLKGK